ncbi:MAG: hybrid sensor histidine kinase/response regulator [Pseudomonadales bacterium]
MSALEGRQTQTILVIDDEEVVRRSFCDQLEDLGYDVIEAPDGAIGIEQAREHSPDLILTDLRMPNLNGSDVIKASREALPDTPVIVISGAGLLDDAVDALRQGAFDYLTKPVKDLKILQATVERALAQVALKRENRFYQQGLESLVEQRTLELSEANEELMVHRNDLQHLVNERTQELEIVIENLTNAQNQLVESEKMASLGRLVAGVAHELNTPIGICITSISSILERLRSFDRDFHKGVLRQSDFVNFLTKSQEYSQIVFDNLNRASELVQNFKMVSVDVSNDSVRSFDLLEYVHSIVQSLQPELRGTNVNITVLGEEGVVVEKHPGTLSQIITNLVVNSLTHAFDEGERGEIEIRIERDQEMVRCLYRDTGKGMSAEVKDKIFEPFFTTRRGTGGSGLGMNIVYNLVTRNLGGVLICESEPGEGTLFTLVFPLQLD